MPPQIEKEQDLSLPQPSFHWRRYALAAIPFALFAAFIIWDLQTYFAYAEKKRQIEKLVSVGSNIDESAAFLKRAGFHVGDKYLPTVDQDYYWVDIQVAHKPRPITLSVLSLVGVRAYFHWVTLEAGLDNRIRRIL